MKKKVLWVAFVMLCVLAVAMVGFLLTTGNWKILAAALAPTVAKFVVFKR